MADLEFGRLFKQITGFEPLSWQTRLYVEHFRIGDLPSAIDLPTGLGKTAVIALWLIARANGVPLPRRLVYVVDRRAVVDQATEFAVRLRQALDEPEAQIIKQALGIEGRSLPGIEITHRSRAVHQSSVVVKLLEQRASSVERVGC